MMDARALFTKHDIDFIDEYSKIVNKHKRAGWIQIKDCPFCGQSKYHLGYNIENQYFNCWSCGWHSVSDTLNLLGIKGFYINYNAHMTKTEIKKSRKTTLDVTKFFKKPKKGITRYHANYLKSRGFTNIPKLIQQYELHYDAHNNIIIPIKLDGKIVSFISHDIKKKPKIAKYKAIKKQDEIVHHKDILYGIDSVYTDYVFLVEGILDCWKLGNESVALFGARLNSKQLILLKNKGIKTVVLMLDQDETGLQASMEIHDKLVSTGFDVLIVSDYGASDPAELDRDQVNSILHSVGVCLVGS